MNLYQLYLDVTALPTPDDQQQFVEKLQQSSAELAAKLRALLSAARQAGDDTLGLSQAVSEAAAQVCASDISSQLTGQRLGYWQLERIIAEGGMSCVYLASRQDGQFEQQVAIKVLNPLIYPVTEQNSAFAEANLTARLSHPGITKVFDGGIVQHHDQAAHYIVMEYVKGLPLDQWLSNAQPDLNTLLTLFIHLADALHYAHTYQIIHADLKPANILVDEHGMPKLIDFGISRLKQQTEATPLYVQRYIRALSLAYASPEQLSGEPLTTLSDVYSLGKVLAFTLAAIPLPVFCRQELSAVIRKATQPENELRYLSMSDIQQDLTAVTRHRPVSAYPATSGYRLRKFIQRQPWVSALSSILLLSGMFFSLALWQKNISLVAERQAAEMVADFMVEVFTVANPSAYDGNPISASDLLLTATSLLAGMDTSLETTHRLQLHLATALKGIEEPGHAWQLLESIPASSRLQSEKLLLMASVKLNQSKLDDVQPLLDQLQPMQLPPELLAEYYLHAGRLAFLQDRLQDSLRYLEQAEILASQEQAYTLLINIKNYKSANYQHLGNISQQLAEAQASLNLAQQHFQPQSAQYVRALNTLQGAYAINQRFTEAAELLEQMYAIQQKMYHSDHPALALTLNEMGAGYSDLLQYEKAIPLHIQAIEIIERRYGQRHIDYIYGHAYLDNAYGYLLRHGEAIEAYKKGLQASEQLYGPDNSITITSVANLGLAYHEQGQHQQAKMTLLDALERVLKNYDESSLRAAYIKASLGSTLLALNEYDESRRHLTEAAESIKNTLGESHLRYQNIMQKLEQFK